MPNFSYSARDKNGAIMKGSLEGVDKQDAARLLMDRGMVPMIVSPAKGSSNFNPLAFISKIRKIPAMEKVIFSRQLATMVGAGLPISQSLHILERQSNNEKMRTVISDISKKVEGGQSLSASLSKYPAVFAPVFVNMIRAGEVGGILDTVLERLATQLEKEHELNAKIKGAMVYPIVILVAMIAVMVVMLTFVIPKIATLFTESGIDLPLPTKILIATSNAFVTFPTNLLMVLALVGVILGFRYYHKTKKGRRQIDRLMLKTPIVGRLISRVTFARFSRTLGSLLQSGIAVLDAMEVVTGTVKNTVYIDELTNMAREVKNGVPIAQPLKQSKAFPPLMGQMVSVGEETGTLDKILIKLAEFYEAEVDRMVGSLSTIIEPVMILIMGVMVAFFVIAMMLPIFKLSQAFGG